MARVPINKWWPPKIPFWTLINGAEINPIGLSSKNMTIANTNCMVRCALEHGLRHFDCAFVDGNEYDIGYAIKMNKEVCREDLFITNKLWNTFHRPDLVERAMCSSLSKMGLDYFDLFMMHYPMAFKNCCDENSDQIHKADYRKVNIYDDVDYLDTWKAMEALCGTDRVRAIGVCNFNYKQMKRLLDNACVAPLMLQIECHPHLMQHELINMCKCNGVHVVATDAMGTTQNYSDPYILRNDRALPPICQKHCKTPAQVLIRYQLQHGNFCLFYTNTYEKMKEDLEVFDFCLDVHDMDVLDGIKKCYRYQRFEPFTDHPEYPFRYKQPVEEPCYCTGRMKSKKYKCYEENDIEYDNPL